MLSLDNQVILKKLGSSDKLGNNQDSEWIIFEDKEHEGWMFIKESNSGHYLRAHGEQQKLTTDGIWFKNLLGGIFLCNN